MILKEVLKALQDPDHVDEDDGDILNMEVKFNTANRSDLTLLSTYVSDGKLIVDVGTGKE